jgi:hypothetical protein
MSIVNLNSSQENEKSILWQGMFNSYIVNIVWIFLDPEQDCINNYGSPPNFADDIQQVLVQK